MSAHDRPLGRRAPTDWRHVERHPLTAAEPLAKPVSVVIGSLWPREADSPVMDSGRHWWIRGPFKRGSRGGHAFCLEPRDGRDSTDNWVWWDQVSEGICVSEGITRAAALQHRRRFQPRPLYDLAQLGDEWPETPPAEGTSVRAGFDVWRTIGLWPARRGEEHWERAEEVDPNRAADPSVRLAENRWATTGDEVLAALGTPERDWVTVLNSWNRDYPHRTRMAVTDLEWLMDRDGEAGIPIFG